MKEAVFVQKELAELTKLTSERKLVRVHFWKNENWLARSKGSQSSNSMMPKTIQHTSNQNSFDKDFKMRAIVFKYLFFDKSCIEHTMVGLYQQVINADRQILCFNRHSSIVESVFRCNDLALLINEIYV